MLAKDVRARSPTSKRGNCIPKATRLAVQATYRPSNKISSIHIWECWPFYGSAGHFPQDHIVLHPQAVAVESRKWPALHEPKVTAVAVLEHDAEGQEYLAVDSTRIRFWWEVLPLFVTGV